VSRSAPNPPLALQVTAIRWVSPLDVRLAIFPLSPRASKSSSSGGLAYTAIPRRRIMCCPACASNRFVFHATADEHNWIIALLATLIVVLLARL